MSISEWISPFVGRVALAWFFLGEAFTRASDWNGTLALMDAARIPAAPVLLVLGLAIMVLGAISLVLGYHARHGAMLLFGFTVAVALALHSYWTVADAAQRLADYAVFVRDIAVAGGLLIVVGLGPGPFAVDTTVRRRRARHAIA